MLGRCRSLITHERPSQVRTKVIPNTRRETLHGEVTENVEPGSALFTDALSSYQGLSDKYDHAFVDHAVKYVQGRVHTNGGFDNLIWPHSLLCFGPTADVI